MKPSARVSSALPLIVVVLGLLYFVMATRAQDLNATLDPTAPAAATAIETVPAVTAAPVTIVDGPGKTVIVPGDVPPIVYIVLGVLVVVLLVGMVYMNRIINLVATLTTPETAREFVQYGLSMGGEFALNLASQTPMTIDEKLIAAYYTRKGYKVTDLKDGSWHIEPPALVPEPPIQPVAAEAPISTTTVNITNNDAPAGGGPAASGEPFPGTES